MPFNRPTLKTLIATIQADIEAHMSGAYAALRRSVLNVLARVQAAAVHGLYGFIAWIKNQILVDSAEAEMLDRHGAIWGVNRIAATYSTGNIEITGVDAAVIPVGTVFKRPYGTQYASDNEVTIILGVATVPVTAIEAGLIGNSDAGMVLKIVAPIPGVTSTVAVAVGGIVGGADEETDDALRARILNRIQAPPHGGADFDYIKWAKDQAGVTRAWVYPQELGLGTVTVRFMMDDTYADGLPLAADVTAVQTALDAVRPVTADLTMVAPVPKLLDPNISGLNPVTQAVKDAIDAEIRDLIRREAAPGATLLKSHIEEAISIAAGEYDHALVIPAADVAHATGEIAVFGAITWS